MKTFNFKKMNKGYALLETIFYICLFAMLSIVVINSLITMTKAFKETTIQAELAQGGNIMERISREVRQAYSINSININSLNNLKLNTTDSVGVNKTVEFDYSSPNIQLIDNGASAVNLNGSGITVTALTFSQITTLKGVAVKISMTIRSSHDPLNRTENFYDTVVLRGGY